MTAPTLMVLVLLLPTGAWPGLGLPRPALCALLPPSLATCCRPPPICPGEKGETGIRGRSGRSGKEGPQGFWGQPGHKGQKGQAGPPGALCQHTYVAFSVGHRKGLHSNDGFQAVPFDTELVNPHGAFDLAAGRFHCKVPGIYFLSLHMHTWNYKEAYLHIMLDQQPTAVLYAQPSECSVMQAHSLLLLLTTGSTVWVRMFHRDQDNAIYGELWDLYITFSGHLVMPAAELYPARPLMAP